MKSLTLVFYGTGSAAAKARADKIRADGGGAQVRDVAMLGKDAEPCDVVIPLNVTAYDVGRLRALYGDKVQDVQAPKPTLTLPPPPLPLGGPRKR